MLPSYDDKDLKSGTAKAGRRPYLLPHGGGGGRAFLAPQALFHSRDPERRLAGRAASRLTERTLSTDPWGYSGGICLFWARESQTWEASSALKLRTASKIWFLTRIAHTRPVPKGQQCLLNKGQVREMLGWVTELGAAGSSSSLLRAGNHLGAEHLQRADPFSWEEQHKRQHGFSLSNTGLFTQANKPSERELTETGGRF